MKKLFITCIATMLYVGNGFSQTLKEVDEHAIVCEQNEVFLRDFSIGTNEEKSNCAHSVILNKGTHYRFHLVDTDFSKSQLALLLADECGNLTNVDVEHNAKDNIVDFKCEKTAKYILEFQTIGNVNNREGICMLTYVGN